MVVCIAELTEFNKLVHVAEDGVVKKQLGSGVAEGFQFGQVHAQGALVGQVRLELHYWVARQSSLLVVLARKGCLSFAFAVLVGAHQFETIFKKFSGTRLRNRWECHEHRLTVQVSRVARFGLAKCRVNLR